MLPFLFAQASGFMNATIIALAYVVMALGLNIVVGFAGLLDLGYVAFYAIGAYCVGWFGSDFFFKAHVHVGVSRYRRHAAGDPSELPADPRRRDPDHVAGGHADRTADAATARRLHRDRDAGLRGDHRRLAVNGQSIHSAAA